MASVKKILSAEVKRVSKRYVKNYSTEDLRTHALSYGWPQSVVGSMFIDRTGTVTFSHPKHKKVAMDLDYGTQDVPPSPAIRTYLLGVM